MSNLREAAEMALQALNMQTPLDKREFELRNSAIEALRQALAEPEQEPVAWMGVEDPTYLSFGKPNWINTIPLYTAPPKREWVGLTDDEIEELKYLHDWEAAMRLRRFARATEAKLKEKNT